MARLTIEQVKAPDFSASSEMMARANQSFTAGIESAKGILDKYNSGQQAKADNALTQLLAGASSEEELEQLLASTDISGMNISDKMRENYLGARGVILGNNQTRQATVNSADSNARANAGESRVAAEYADGVAARDELRGMTPAYVAALTEGQRYGTGTGDAPVANWLKMENEGATRNDPLAPELVDAMSFLGDMGITMRVVSGGQEDNGPNGTGSTRHNHGNSADADFYIGDRKLDWNNPDDVPIFQQIVSQAKANGVTGIGAGDDYMGAGRMHVGFGNPGVWGAGGSGANAPEWLKAAYNGAPVGTAPVRENPMGGKAASEFAAVLQAGTRLTPDQASKLYSDVLSGQAQGQSLIDAAESKRQTELAAEATRTAILDPNNTSETAVQRDLLTTPGLSYGNLLSTAGQDLSTFGGVIAPTPAADAEVAAALERTRAEDVPTGDNVFTLAQEFGAGENANPVKPMFDTLGVEAPKEKLQQYDSALVDYAEAAGVTASEAAAALATLQRRDGIDAQRALELFKDQEEYGTMVGLIQDLVGDDAKEANRVSSAERVSREAQRAATELELTAAKTRAMKLPQGSPERAAAEAEIAAMRDTVIAGKTPQQREKLLIDYVSKTGSGSLLKSVQSEMEKYPEGTPQGDKARADFFRVMTQLEDTIMADENLTDTEKELLLADIRG